ncbi:PREDICTED: uncharacterized protein LOC109353936 [Lupinus angustifolius]|uniref:uncharacterized protein LOC109353936 n=1 Tax=Lupinus angustifolius TaxID=3871 RepID=UPI00092E48EC|nr:PREDICTED: uncharacterized protein LOC109353936 [Lupinus angustifolius]
MNDNDNPVVANDLRLVGKLWADDSLDEELEEESFTNVLSKSQKKILKKKSIAEKSYNTCKGGLSYSVQRSSTLWNSLNLDLFVVNNRGDDLPNLWGLCSRGVVPQVLLSTSQFLAISVTLDNKVVNVCVIYAHTSYIQRRILWSDAQDVISAFPGPWCFIGDFNTVVGANECRSSRVPARIPSEEFKAFIDNVNLLHLPTRGAPFTWSNRRTGSTLTKKRRVISNAWMAKFSGCPMFILSQKLKLLKKDLRTWKMRVFGNIHHTVNNALSNVDLIQNYIVDFGPNPELLEQEDQAQKSLFHALEMEEVFWKEKCMINWHTHGDRNTKFFHRVTKIRQATKAMSILMDRERILCNQDDIANHVLNYYTDLFGSTKYIAPNDLIQSVIPSIVSDDENLMITSVPSHKEIKDVVFGLNGDGAPGLDGFGGCFYQAFWDIVGNDVCCSVAQFFSQGWILPNMNSNSVILIPKNTNAVKLSAWKGSLLSIMGRVELVRSICQSMLVYSFHVYK